MTPFRLIAASVVLFAAPIMLHAQREKLPPDDVDYVEQHWPNARKSNTGIRYVVEHTGKGPLLQPGDLVMVNYIGTLLHGRVFDRNQDKIHPLTFRVDRGDVIEGWDQILQMMRPGDRWTVIIPPELAYGRRGRAPLIPGDATLVFKLEILGIKSS
ncbi:MAG TPA: FKBP-type peptidyl-prolyl cis-trans isomerase [Opitutaceae bacterium]|jgi:FKBP-type peptidyl-prolyl cis-trans isomerase